MAAGLLTLAATAACMDLSPRAAGVCGNGVLEEPMEDCDAPRSAACNDQCRLTCQVATDCPPAWACGADQLCERATGRWHEVGTPFPESALDMRFADLDGDGRLDVFGYDSRRLWANLGQPGGGFATGISLPNQGAAPAFGDLDGDGFDDAVGAGPSSLSLAFGHQARTGFKPQGQPALTVPANQLSIMPMRTGAAPFHDLVEVWLIPGIGVEARIQRVGGGLGPQTTVVPGATSVEGLAVVDLDGDDRDELVVLTSFTRARVFSAVDDRPGPPRLTLRAAVAFPVPAGHTRSFAADVTGDGIRDLVVDVGSSVQVAAGNGSGGFAAAVANPALDVTGDLLALTDLDGDGVADLVGADGIRLRRGGGSVQVAASSAPWTDAVVADFNRDGRPDVAALVPGGAVELLRAAPGNLYNRGPSVAGRVFCTGGAGSRARGCPRAGDFDGDQYPDLAFVATGDGHAELRVLFGGPQGLTGDGSSLGDVELVSPIEQATFDLQVAQLRVDEGGRLTDDAIADLVMQTTASLGQDPVTVNNVTFFMGNGDRVASALYAVAGPPALTAVGRFRPDGGRSGEIIVQYGDGTLDLIGGADDRRLGAEDRQALPVTPAGRRGDWCVGQVGSFPRGVRIGDLDGDGRDELVGVTCAVAAEPVGVQIARVIAAPLRLELTDVPLPAEAQPLGPLGDVQLVDLDGDGRLDLVLVFGGTTTAQTSLLVLWGRDGAFAGGHSLLRGSTLETFLSTAVVEANGEPRRELLVGTTTPPNPTTLIRVEVVGADRALVLISEDPAGLPSLPFAPGAGLLAEPVVRATDLDGDGIDDVVLATTEGLRVFLGCGRHTPACP